MSSSTLLIISGASRGLGRSIAKAFDERCRDLHVHLIARSRDGLEGTKSILSNNSENRISLYEMDLGDLDRLEENMNTLVSAVRPFSQYREVIVINNAGSLGHLGNLTDMSSLQEFREVWDLNTTSSSWFSTRWAKELQSHSLSTIVNISSLGAIQSFPSMGTYCAGKSARNMFHLSLAKECPSVQILNYAPGPLKTDMMDQLLASETLDKSIQKSFRECQETGALIDPITTSQKLVKVVLERNYQSGSHIDYYDLPSIDDEVD